MSPKAGLNETDGITSATAQPEIRPVKFWVPRGRQPQLLALVIGLACVFIIIILRGPISAAKLVGYPGVFLLSFFGSAAMLLPIPGVASVCTVSIVLNPLLVGLIAGVGETIGETFGYAVGYGGQGVVVKSRFYRRVRGWMRSRGTLILFVVSAIPNPIFDVVGIAAGATKFPFGRFLVTVLAGKLCKSIVVAYACSVGLKHLLLGFD